MTTIAGPRDGSEWRRPKGDQYAQWLVEHGRAKIEEADPPLIDRRGSFGSHWEEPRRERFSGVMLPSKRGHNGRAWEERLEAYFIQYGNTWLRVSLPNWDFVPRIEGDFAPVGNPTLKIVTIHGIKFKPCFPWSADFKAYMRTEVGKLFKPMPATTRYKKGPQS